MTHWKAVIYLIIEYVSHNYSICRRMETCLKRLCFCASDQNEYYPMSGKSPTVTTDELYDDAAAVQQSHVTEDETYDDAIYVNTPKSTAAAVNGSKETPELEVHII